MKTIKTKQFAVEIYGAEDFCLVPLRDLIDNDEEFVKTLTTLITEYGDNNND